MITKVLWDILNDWVEGLDLAKGMWFINEVKHQEEDIKVNYQDLAELLIQDSRVDRLQFP